MADKVQSYVRAEHPEPLDGPCVIVDDRGDKYVLEPMGPAAMVFLPDRELWERQPAEDDKPFKAFQVFRDLDPAERKLSTCFQIVQGSWSATTDQFSRWRKAYRWDERVAAYDMYVDDKIRQELESRRLAARKATADLGQAMRGKAWQALQALEAIIYNWVIDEDGNRVKQARSALSPRQITQLAEVGTKLERLALGEGIAMTPVAPSLTMVQVNIGDDELVTRAKDAIAAREKYAVPLGEL